MTRASKRKATVPKPTTKANAKAGTKDKKPTETSKKAEKVVAGSLAATQSKAPVDPFAFEEGDVVVGSISLTVKWVMKGHTTSEWTFSVPADATVDSLRKMVEETTDGVLKAHAIILKHKSKEMDRTSALLSDYGIGDGSEVVLLLNHEAGPVPVPPTAVNHGFPGEPVAKKAKKDKKEGQSDKKRERFTKAEAEDLIKGVELYGLGQWAQIKLAYFRSTQRTGVDLKDKWRNLVTASQRPPGFKFRVEYLNDPAFLGHVAKVNTDALSKHRE